MAKIGINGFGRIGRNVIRAMSPEMRKEVVMINDLTDNATLAHLLKWDSIMGKFDAVISHDEDGITIDGHRIKVTAERDPGKLAWAAEGAEVILESTGFFTDRDKAGLHITGGGAKKVLISAPSKDPDITVCVGINTADYDGSKHHIVSNASCTTNCLAPMVKVLHEAYGIEIGFMSTIHSYTNDQRLLDLPHSDLRRARAAAINIIPSSTGAAKAIGEVIPELKGKLTGGAFRVPTPNGSVTDFTARLKSVPGSVEEINAKFKEAYEGSLKGVLDYNDEFPVLQDIVGNPHSCVFDPGVTLAMDNMVKVVGWYDNEWGYSNRTVDVLKMLGN